VNDALSWVLDLVQDVDPVLRILLAGIGIMLETSILVGLLVPGDTVVIVASTAVSGPLEYVFTILAVIAGAIAGESIGFGLGRYFGPKIRASRIGRRIGEANWRRAEYYLDRRGGIAVFVSRFLPVFHSIIPLTVGMSTMRYRRFIAWTLPACVIWSVAYISVGWAAASSYRRLAARLNEAGILFVAVIVLFLLVMYVVKRLLRRGEDKHMLRPGDGDPNTRDDPAA